MHDPASPCGETSDSSEPTHEAAIATLPAPIEWYHPPRLGIIHLLAWVTVAAVLMKIGVAMESYLPPPTPASGAKVLPIGRFQHAAGQILTAAILVGGFVVCRGCWQRKPGCLQPGHWILAIGSAIALARLLFGTVVEIAFRGEIVFCRMTPLAILSFALMLVRAAAFCYAAWRLPEPRRWKWVLVFDGLQFVVTLVLALFATLLVSSLISISWLRFFLTYANTPLLLAVLAAIAIDLAKGLRRDWLHWLGALLPLLQFLLTIAFRALESFLRTGP